MIRLFVLMAAWSACAAAQVAGAGADWLTYAGNYQGWRFSSLRQVTPENAGHMVSQWTYRVPNAAGLRTSPIVARGVLYATDTNAIYALDAKTGRLIWRYVDTKATRKGVNRGAAIWEERVYFTTADNRLVALDRQTGALIFSRQFADPEKGITSTSAPVIAEGKVIVGSAGGDTGMRGFVAALSARTGEELWRTFTVPAKGEPGAETWGDLIEWGGGATWLSGTYDPETKTLYWTTGNPWPDFTGTSRQGDNLYTCSLLALDLETGARKWHFQFTPHDTHDWDAQSWPVLLEAVVKGERRKVVVHANRNGFYYVLDRATGEFLHATKLVDKLTWAEGVDAKGRPIEIPGMDPTPEGVMVCPSVKGATNWMGQSYHPGTGLLYVLTLEQCGLFSSSQQEPVPMKNFQGGGATQVGGQFILRALEPATGRRVWEYPMTGDTNSWTGVVSTAGGVVFSGDDDGHLVALDASTGRHLWHYNLGEPLSASPVSFAVDGKQYVAIASATAIHAFALFEPITPVQLPKTKKR
ncbi:MAG TPA: PQQ-dependent dehydrogenase, methanol/ethanol family [Solibacterales bacterium]|nr:PQQ-dependent dehydrogenase, methanol/ethanol family [Bryobacterales bacterium]